MKHEIDKLIPPAILFDNNDIDFENYKKLNTWYKPASIIYSGYYCVLCGITGFESHLHGHHVKPRALGGLNGKVVDLCPNCHINLHRKYKINFVEKGFYSEKNQLSEYVNKNVCEELDEYFEKYMSIYIEIFSI